MVGDNPAIKIVYSLPEERGCDPTTRSIKVMDHYVVEGEKLYFISYSAATYSDAEEYETTTYDRYLPVVQKLINSFEIIQNEQTSKGLDVDRNTEKLTLVPPQLGKFKNIASVQYDC